MRMYLPLLLCLTLPACFGSDEPRTIVETRLILPPVPAEFRTPVDPPALEAESVADIGKILVAQEVALEEANARITGTDCILRDAEALAGQDVATCP